MPDLERTLGQVVDLFQLWTPWELTRAEGEESIFHILDLCESAALAVTLRLLGQQAGNRASRCRSQKKPTFSIVSREDRYDRTL